MSMRQLEIAICLIRRGDSYLLQLRGDNPVIGAAGLIGAFGGKLEVGETAVEAVLRELQEETSLRPSTDALIELGIFEVVSDHQLEPVRVNVTAFRFDIDESEDMVAHEGQLVSFTKEASLKTLEQFTPATRHCFEILIKEEK